MNRAITLVKILLLFSTFPLGAYAQMAGRVPASNRITPSPAYCWGEGSNGQHGTGSYANLANPSTVPVETSGSSVLMLNQISNGSYHSCGVDKNRTGYCWGQNADGQLGKNDQNSSPIALPVAGSIKWLQLSAGFYHTCGRTETNVAYCWGKNDFKQAGHSSQANTKVPNQISIGPVQDISAGGEISCAVRATDNLAFCWGRVETQSSSPFLIFENSTSNPKQISPTVKFKTVSAGVNHACGLEVSGKVYCWGKNDTHRLGNGNSSDSESPVLVGFDPALRFQSVGAGENHGCALSSDDKIYCWGSNEFGQLGNNWTMPSTANTPQEVVPSDGALNSFRTLSVGKNFNCAIHKNGKTYCWGIGEFGRLGNGETTNRNKPTPVIDNSSNSQIFTALMSSSSMARHSCAIKY